MRRGTPCVRRWISGASEAGNRVARMRPRHRQAVRDVGAGLGIRQRPEVVARDHALGQLFQLGLGQHGAQLGLADQDDLQQLALAGLQVGQQAQLFQHLGRQVLRLVDHQHVVVALGVAVQQVAVDGVDIAFHAQRAGGCGRQLDAELVADRQQQFLDRQLGIEDVGQAAVVGNLLDEAAAHRGLAGADLARQQDEAAAAADAVQQVGQRLAMALAHEEVARIGRDRERLLLQVEVVSVHTKGNAYCALHCGLRLATVLRAV
jgi:hypothetical protein